VRVRLRDAEFHGSESGKSLAAPVVGISADPNNTGYWLVGADAESSTSTPVLRLHGGKKLNAPVVGIAATPEGVGYWLVASDGGIFSFGRPVPRIDGWAAPQQADDRHGGDARGLIHQASMV